MRPAWIVGGLLAVGVGCAATPPADGVRLAAAIDAERANRFAGPPEQTARDITIHSEYPGRLPPAFAAEAAAIRNRFRRLLGRTDEPTPLSILVFDSPRRLQRVLGVSSGVHGLALTRAEAPVIVLAAGEGDTALRRHLRHEITHIASDLAADPSLTPEQAAWVEEGLAYLLEWSDEDGIPFPSLGLLQILHEAPPHAFEVPVLVSAHYRPRGDAPTMRRLAAAAATLIHFYWDRAVRSGSADVRAMLTACAQRTRAELQADDAAWQHHWRRVLQLARAKSLAGQAARYCDDAAQRLRAADDQDGAARLGRLADTAERLHAAARGAAAPGGDLDPSAARTAGQATIELAELCRAGRRRGPEGGFEILRLALDRLALAVQAAERAERADP